jgi:hypothetical protein
MYFSIKFMIAGGSCFENNKNGKALSAKIIREINKVVIIT